MKLRLWLTVWGILAFMALAWPGLVAAGMFLLVLPGMILLAAPTVFLYSAVFAFIRSLFPRPAGWKLNIIAGLSALYLGWLVAQP